MSPWINCHRPPPLRQRYRPTIAKRPSLRRAWPPARHRLTTLTCPCIELRCPRCSPRSTIEPESTLLSSTYTTKAHQAHQVLSTAIRRLSINSPPTNARRGDRPDRGRRFHCSRRLKLRVSYSGSHRDTHRRSRPPPISSGRPALPQHPARQATRPVRLPLPPTPISSHPLPLPSAFAHRLLPHMY